MDNIHSCMTFLALPALPYLSLLSFLCFLAPCILAFGAFLFVHYFYLNVIAFSMSCAGGTFSFCTSSYLYVFLAQTGYFFTFVPSSMA